MNLIEAVAQVYDAAAFPAECTVLLGVPDSEDGMVLVQLAGGQFIGCIALTRSRIPEYIALLQEAQEDAE